MATATQEPDLETLRFAADPHWFGRAPGLAVLDKLYRAGRTGLYLSLSMYWWLGSRFGGPRSGGKLGPLRRALLQRSARKRAEQRSPALLLVRDTARIPEGQPIAVRGTVRARGLLAADLHGPGTVHHRVDLDLELGQAPGAPVLAVRKYDHLIYEAACDFDLADERGDVLRVEVARAALVAAPAKRDDHAWAPLERLRRLDGPPEALEHLRTLALRKSAAGHTRLRDGDRVTVYGWKSAFVDPSITERLERETPLRTVVRGAPAERLLIFPDQARDG
ncbi:MAG: hypothetical protein IT370_22135 [Deltaproteobacteria bacterium]|nr:hypothetical protein [Deltaproteobacteria bacterium]